MDFSRSSKWYITFLRIINLDDLPPSRTTTKPTVKTNFVREIHCRNFQSASGTWKRAYCLQHSHMLLVAKGQEQEALWEYSQAACHPDTAHQPARQQGSHCRTYSLPVLYRYLAQNVRLRNTSEKGNRSVMWRTNPESFTFITWLLLMHISLKLCEFCPTPRARQTTEFG